MIVTGASSGIGFEISRYLAEGGNDVVMACRNAEKGKAAVERIQAELPNSIVTFMEVSWSVILANFTEFQIFGSWRLWLIIISRFSRIYKFVLTEF